MRKITINNFFEKTIGTFEFIADVNEFFESSKYGTKIKAQKYFKELIAKELGAEIKDVKHNFTSFNSNYKSASIYFEIKNTNKLIRISDHWSKSNVENVKQVGNVRSCYWILASIKKTISNSKFQMGMIELDKFAENE